MADDKFVWVIWIDRGMILPLIDIHSIHCSEEGAQKECYKVYSETPKWKPKVVKVPLKD